MVKTNRYVSKVDAQGNLWGGSTWKHLKAPAWRIAGLPYNHHLYKYEKTTQCEKLLDGETVFFPLFNY